MMTALSDGMTLEGLDLESGDEVVVGTKTSKPWVTVLQYSVPIFSAVIFSVFLRRR